MPMKHLEEIEAPADDRYAREGGILAGELALERLFRGLSAEAGGLGMRKDLGAGNDSIGVNAHNPLYGAAIALALNHKDKTGLHWSPGKPQ